MSHTVDASGSAGAPVLSRSEQLRQEADHSLFARLRFYLTPVDGRFEDLSKGNVGMNVLKDATAGLIVAMIAIPLAMGFAMASGLRPEQGIVGGAVAGLIGALFGGSKYQVYGPTAAFIPVIAGMTATHEQGFLIFVSILAGLILIGLGLAKAGSVVAKVPHSIVVGFTIGIAFVIAFSQAGEVLGLHAKLGYEFMEKVHGIVAHIGETNPYAIVLAIITFAIVKVIIRISPMIPGPLIALGVGTLLAGTVWSSKGLTTIGDKYGHIPLNSLVITWPSIPQFTPAMLYDVAFYVTAIVFVSAIESLLCSRMADRLANNQGTPYHPNKELWGQGWVQIAVPLLNGFPHTGALARTATNIKLGAISPLAGVFKFAFKLTLAAFLAHYLEMVPMACIGGILMFVASGMVKPAEVKEVFAMNRAHVALMAFTAVMVVATDFLKGVLSALVVFVLFNRFFKDSHADGQQQQSAA